MTSVVLSKRLRADYEKVRLLVSQSNGTIQLNSVDGSPPHKYEITYHCRGIESLQGVDPIFRDIHKVTIQLYANYPREKPTVKIETPIFHPHVFENNIVCIGNWTITESLDNLILRVGSLIQYDPKYFDFRSPANRQAKVWAEQNMHRFPIGKCNFKGQAKASGAITWTDL